MSMEEELKNVIEIVVENRVPRVRNRTRLIDYLFKHSIGNKLPRGKDFNPYRIAENLQKFNSVARNYNSDIERLTYKNRISPLLQQQRYLLALAVISRHVQFNTDASIDVIKKLEGDTPPPSTNLIKYDLKFGKKGLLSEYMHHHVPLLPNSFLKMYSSRRKNEKSELINLSLLESLVDRKTGLIDLNEFEKKINGRNNKRSGRVTGHWLITKKIGKEKFYLGVFPHSNGVTDDRWIKQKLIYSEMVLRKKMHYKKK